jgi:hypothetical protein
VGGAADWHGGRLAPQPTRKELRITFLNTIGRAFTGKPDQAFIEKVGAKLAAAAQQDEGMIDTSMENHTLLQTVGGRYAAQNARRTAAKVARTPIARRFLGKPNQSSFDKVAARAAATKAVHAAATNTIVKTYTGKPRQMAGEFQCDARSMARNGYEVSNQNNFSGHCGGLQTAAGVATLSVAGLIARPKDAMIVTYTRRAPDTD